MRTSTQPFKTGGERPHKRGSEFHPFRTTRAKSPTFDFPLWLKYPFSEYRRLE